MFNNKMVRSAGIAILFLLLIAAGVVYCDRTASADEKLAFTNRAPVIRVGDSKLFAVNLEGASWTSSNRQVADFSGNGTLVARRSGSTIVTAAAGAQSVSMEVRVKPVLTVGIDPGHQAHIDHETEPNGPGSSVQRIKASGGAKGVSTGKAEYQLNLEIAGLLQDALEKRGYRVVLSRTDNGADLSNMQRALKLNRSCDAVIRLHADGGAPAERGALALYPSRDNEFVGELSDASERLSEEVLNAYCAATGMKNLGIVTRDDLSGMNWSEVPITMLEMGFMSNVMDDEYMSSPHGQRAMAEGIADGVDAYFR